MKGAIPMFEKISVFFEEYYDLCGKK